jgi:hypothetical protein
MFNEEEMTATQYKSWQSRYGLTVPKAAQLLGVAEITIYKYRSGALKIPFHIKWRCWHIAEKIKKGRGRYSKKERLEGAIMPYLRRLFEEAQEGTYHFYEEGL